MKKFRDRKGRREGARLKRESQEMPTTWLIEMDGALFDDAHSLEETYFKFLKNHGQEGNKEEFYKLCGMPLQLLVDELTERYGLRKDKSILYEQYRKLLAEMPTPRVHSAAEQCLLSMQEQGFSLCLIAPLGKKYA